MEDQSLICCLLLYVKPHPSSRFRSSGHSPLQQSSAGQASGGNVNTTVLSAR